MEVPSLFYLFATISLLSCGGGVLYRIILWRRGKKVHRINSFSFLNTLTLKPLLFLSPVRWLSHLLIFISFLGLFFIGSVGDFLNDYHFIKLPKDTPWFAITNDILGFMLIGGVLLSLFHRLFSSDPELRNKEQISILFLIFVVAVTGFWTEVARLINWKFHSIIWWGHALLSLFLIGIIPWTFLFHPVPSTVLSLMEDTEKFFKIENFDINSFSRKDLISLDACTKCGLCAQKCEIYRILEDEVFAPRGKIETTKNILNNESRIRDRFSEGVFGCTLCGRCKVVCPSKIHTKDLMLSMRYALKEEHFAPENLYRVSESVMKDFNVFGYPNEERKGWLEFVDEPETVIKKSRTLYFVGCLSSFSPPAQEIPQAVIEIFKRTETTISLMEEEVCCGYPLLISGFLEEAEKLREKNIQQIEKLKPETIVFNCPSCLYTWKKFYYPFLRNVKMLHITQFLLSLKLPALKNDRVITYHDPCDLGRGLGIYEEPRKLIEKVEGTVLKEMKEHKEMGFCCGGGGDIEMFAPALSERVAEGLISRAEEVAETLITACPQCKRMALRGKKDKKVEIYDITEYILSSIIDG